MTSSAHARPARLSVGLVGVGRAGSVIGAALDRVGHRVVAVSAVSDSSRSRAAALLPHARITDPIDVAKSCDLLVLAVPDDVLPDLLRGLVAAGAIAPGRLVAHLSGRHGVDVLEAAVAAGAGAVALHPAMTLTGAAHEVQRLDGCPFAIDASEGLRPVAEALVVELGGEPVWIDPDLRTTYHAALCHGSNHLVTLVAQAQDLLRAAGVDAPGRFLAPLLSATLDNVLRAGDAALTGPVSRGDAGTVAAHLAAVDAVDPVTAATYSALSRATALRSADRRALSPEQVADLLDALTDGDRSGGVEPAQEGS